MTTKSFEPKPLVPHPPDTRTWRAVKRGATWGSLAGLIAGHLLMRQGSFETPVGLIYGGNVLLILGVPIGIGAGLGAAIGWLSTQRVEGDDDRLELFAVEEDEDKIELGVDERVPNGAAGAFMLAGERPIFLAEDGSCYVDFGTGVKKFSTASAFRTAYDDHSTWVDVLDEEQIKTCRARLCAPSAASGAHALGGDGDAPGKASV